jgi:hypothetical protein
MGAMAHKGLRWIKWPAYALCLGLLAVLANYDYYVFVMNRANHTGFEVRQLAWAGLACGVASLALGVATGARAWAVAAVLGFALFANVYGLERAQIMMNYDDWVRSGMPERPR